MSLLFDTLRWFTDAAHYRGSDAVQVRVLEHLELSALAVLLGALVALPIGLYLGHTGRFGFIAVSVANVGRALPSLALLAFSLPLAFSLGLGLGFWPTLFSLIPLALPFVLAGMRTAAVNVVATATLGALVAGGGLGRYIVDGLALREFDRLFAGALLVAVLAITVEVAFGTFERRATSPGLRAGSPAF